MPPEGEQGPLHTFLLVNTSTSYIIPFQVEKETARKLPKAGFRYPAHSPHLRVLTTSYPFPKHLQTPLEKYYTTIHLPFNIHFLLFTAHSLSLISYVEEWKLTICNQNICVEDVILWCILANFN